MLEGKIRKLDLAERTIVVQTADGRVLTAQVPEGAVIEVSEPETMGTMGGEFSDLEEGYLVSLDIREHLGEGHCSCAAVVCVS